MATTAPLILKGNLKLGSSSGTALEVGDQVTAWALKQMRDTIAIPATLAATKSIRAGGESWTLDLGYLSSDGSLTDDVFGILYTQALTDDAQCYFEGSQRNGAVSATNPKWSGTFVVTENQFGGDAEGLSIARFTYQLIARPTRATS